MKKKSLSERFWSKVSLPHGTTDDDCWEWVAAKCGYGYGRMFFNGKNRNAHAISVFINRGEVTSRGMDVMHMCDQPSCVNPHHLKIGTHSQNLKDSFKRTNRIRGFGEENGNNKLKKEDVIAIRASKKFIGSGVILAKKYGVAPSYIAAIRNRKVWKAI